MANYIKSFNFRSGVQVDNDNFVVNPNGLVGIGTTLPGEILDVRGNAKIVGHVTTTDLSVSGIVTVGSITINGSTGTISASTFTGSAGNFGDQAVVAIATDGFIAGATGLTTTSNLGVNTTSTAFELQVGGDPTISGFGVTEGNITASGNLKISGISTTATLVVTGLSTTKDFEVTGVSTIATLGVTGLTTTKDFEVTGVSTIATLGVTGLTTTKDFEVTGVTTVGFITASSLQVAGVSTLGIVTASNIYSTGVVTATSFVGTLTGSATSLATAKNFSITGDLEASAVSFNGEGHVVLASTLSNSFSANTSGIITAATVVSSGIGSFNSIGIQTSSPSVDLQIRKASGDATLEVISDTATSSIGLGNSVGGGNGSGMIRHGSDGSGYNDFSDEKSLDIINFDTGSVNFFLDAGTVSAAGTGGFHWNRGKFNNPIMSLTYDGNLGIGKTNPTHSLHVVGPSTFTGNAHFDSNLTFSEGTVLTATFRGDVKDASNNLILDVSEALLIGNVNVTSGVSTFSRVSTSSTVSANNLTIGSNTLHSNVDHKLSINSSGGNRFYVTDNGRVGISTNLEYGFNIGLSAPGKHAIFAGVGIGTTTLRCAADFADAGIAGITTHRYFLPPKVSTTDRNGIGGTVTGAVIYNITDNKLQVYTGSAWETVTSS
jgi:hypothetical protein